MAFAVFYSFCFDDQFLKAGYEIINTKGWVRIVSYLSDTELEKNFAKGLRWLFVASAVNWLQHTISPGPIANFKENNLEFLDQNFPIFKTYIIFN